MSLIGSLEDLSLGDILQIISLSQKSGVLNLRTKDGDGRIVFENGLVRGAQAREGSEDLRAVLVGGSFVSDADFEEIAREAGVREVGLEVVIEEKTSIGRERLDSLLREAVESAVVGMFGWKVGEFSFDIQGEGDPVELPVLLPLGINAQYLAMEGLRVRDESERDDPQPVETADVDDAAEMSAHEMFGVAPPDEDEVDDPPEADTVDLAAGDRIGDFDAAPIPEARPLDDAELDVEEITEYVPVAEAIPVSEPSSIGESITLVDAEPISPAETIAEADCEAELIEPVADDSAPLEAPILEAPMLDPPALEEPAHATNDGPARDPTPEVRASDRRPIVVIDEDLGVLEWTKRSLAPAFARVHIFQNSELGLTRIRQYLARAELPIVLLSPQLTVDRLGGISDVRDFVRRLKAQASEITTLWIGGSDAGADGAVARPDARMFNDGRRVDELLVLGEALLDAVLASTADADSAGETPMSSGELERLKRATAGINEAADRGEVLPYVIRFASERFSRVAMFMVRDGQVLGMAQAGLAAAGGPDDAGLRDLSLGVETCGWFRRVVAERSALRAPPGDDGDRMLASLLGSHEPSEAYLAPIVSGGQVIAIVYGDNLPGDQPFEDTSGLEVVLHHAGLAMDRVALERALGELVADGPAGIAGS